MIDIAALEQAVLRLVAECAPGKTIAPAEAAQALAGARSEDWGPLMQPLRRIAIRLAREGRIVIYRKGKPADPDAFKGVYRLGPSRLD